MAGLYTSKRAIFPRRKQKEFLLNTKRILNLSYIDLAKLLKISRRTLTDWKREKFSMTLRAVKILIRKTNRKMPKDMEIKYPFWYVNKAAKLGGAAVYKKYGKIGGDPEIRKQRWYEWWKREGKYKNNSILSRRLIKKPKYSEKLAEFVGIVLGDGGIAQYQVVVTLNSKNERKYSKFVVKLMKELFNVPVGVHYDKKCFAVDLVVSRSELVRFCIEKLGLKKGSKVKQQVDIPNWIRQNKLYSIACLRGLIDTDGCVFSHHYRVNGKMYSYKKLTFSNHSKPILKSVCQFLQTLGMNPRIAKDEKDVRLESIKDIYQYFLIVNSHNPKILQRYRK